jgi:hypothetical protein
MARGRRIESHEREDEARDVNQLPGLISADPLEYAAAHIALCVLPSQSLTAILAPRGDARPETAPIGLRLLDTILTAAVTVLLPAAYTGRPVMFAAAVASALLFATQQVVA